MPFGSGSSQPKAPDPAKVAAQQTQSNVQTATANAWLNNPNIVNPWGNTTNTQTGEVMVGGQKVPQFTQTNTLSPEQQKLYEQGVSGDTQLNQLGLDQIGRINQAVSQPFSLASFGDQPTYNDQYRQQQQDALMARLQPQLDQEQQQLDQRLANQGIGLGSEAYGAGQDQIARSRNDARLAAISQSGNEAARQYGIDSSSYQQRLANALLERQQPLQEYAQFTGASNNFVQPGQVGFNASQVQPTDVAGPIYANYNAKVNAANQQGSSQGSGFGALAGLAGSALGGWASGGFGW